MPATARPDAPCALMRSMHSVTAACRQCTNVSCRCNSLSMAAVCAQQGKAAQDAQPRPSPHPTLPSRYFGIDILTLPSSAAPSLRCCRPPGTQTTGCCPACRVPGGPLAPPCSSHPAAAPRRPASSWWVPAAGLGRRTGRCKTGGRPSTLRQRGSGLVLSAGNRSGGSGDVQLAW